MADVSDSELAPRVENAVLKRKAYILENIETVSLKAVRRLLETDLGLPPARLDTAELKAVVRDKIDEVIQAEEAGMSQRSAEEPAGEIAEPSGTAAPSSEPVKPSKPERQEQKQPRPKEKKRAEKKADGATNGHKEKSKSGKRQKEHEQEEEPDTTKRQKPEKEGAPPRAVVKTEEKVESAIVKRLKTICRQATIRIAPQVYIRNKDEAALTAALEELLEKHGLSSRSDTRAIERVKKSLERQRDLDGINMDNIVEDAGRRPRRAAADAARANYRAMLQPIKVDDEDEDDDSEDDNATVDDDQNGNGTKPDNAARRSSKPRGKEPDTDTNSNGTPRKSDPSSDNSDVESESEGDADEDDDYNGGNDSASEGVVGVDLEDDLEDSMGDAGSAEAKAGNASAGGSGEDDETPVKASRKHRRKAARPAPSVAED